MTKLIALADETKIAAIIKALGANGVGTRVIFDSVDDATAKLAAAAEATENFYDLPVALPLDKEGEFDSSIFGDGMQVAISTVGSRVDVSNEKKVVGIKGIVLFPMPTLDAYIADKAGRDWLEKVATKESAHVAFRAYRESESVEEFLTAHERAPKTLADYVTEAERSGGVDTEVFDTVWKSLRPRIGKDRPDIAQFLTGINKPDIIKSIRSTAYATEDEQTNALEKAGVWKWIAALAIKGAESAGMDASSIKDWVANRDELKLTRPAKKALDLTALENIKLDEMAD